MTTPDPPIWRRLDRLVVYAHAAPNRVFCRGMGLRERSRSLTPAQRVNTRGGQELLALGTPHEIHRTAFHRSVTWSRWPARCCLKAPKCRLRYAPPKRANRIRAHGNCGTPLLVIWLFPSGPGSPVLC
jgi:hypothetical protein